jgi:hypothetical protein
MNLQTNENMSEYTILPQDGWEKIADNGDVINMQNTSDGDAILQVTNNEPAGTVNWGTKLWKKTDKPFVCTHNVYARAVSSTIIIVVQKD